MIRNTAHRGALLSVVVSAIIVIVVLLSSCSPQTALPTLAVLPSTTPTINLTTVAARPTFTPSPTITDTPAPSLTPSAATTIDFAALDATSAAISNPLKTELEKLADLQTVRLVSAMMLSDGVSVTIEAQVAPADDNEFTMARVFDIVKRAAPTVSQIRLNTAQTLWLWEDGKWSGTRLATGEIVEATTVSMLSQPPAVFTPGNCATAVAAGLTAEQASQWKHLDRDKDGVACYGD